MRDNKIPSIKKKDNFPVQPMIIDPDEYHPNLSSKRSSNSWYLEVEEDEYIVKAL